MAASVEQAHSLWEFSAEAVTAWASGVTATIAALAALIAFFQIRELRRAGNISDAQDSYRSYLQLAIDHPRLASPDFDSIRKDAILKEQYDWFVAYFLSAAEKILSSVGSDEYWVETIKLNIGYHARIIGDKEAFEDKQLGCYDLPLRKLIFLKTQRGLDADPQKTWLAEEHERAKADR